MTQLQFSDKSANRIYENYIRQINSQIRVLPSADQEEIRKELTSHLFESMQADNAGEVEKLLNAIDRLGDTEEYIRPIVAEKLIDNAGRTLHPRSVALAFAKNVGTTIRKTVLFSIFGFIYLAVFGMAIASLTKLFNPEVGLYIGERTFVIGVVDPGTGREVLGYWIIPITVGLAILLYAGTTKILRFLSLR